MALLSILITALLISGCGAHLPYDLAAPVPVKPAQKDAQRLEVEFVDTDGQSQDLSQMTSKPIVLLFGQTFCTTCLEEALAIRDKLLTLTKPSQVLFFSIQVGADLDESREWKGQHQIPWVVGADLRAQLFRKFCSKTVVPCTVVYRPEKGVVLTEQKKLTVEELMEVTGPWEAP